MKGQSYETRVTINTEHWDNFIIYKQWTYYDEVQKMFADLDNGPVYIDILTKTVVKRFEIKEIELLELEGQNIAWFHLGMNPKPV